MTFHNGGYSNHSASATQSAIHWKDKEDAGTRREHLERLGPQPYLVVTRALDSERGNVWSETGNTFTSLGPRGSGHWDVLHLLFTGSVSLSTDFTSWLGMYPFCSQSWYSEIRVPAWHLSLIYASHSYYVLFMSVFSCGTFF